MKNNFLLILSSLLIASTLISCSFVESLPGDHHIIQVNQTAIDSANKLDSNTCETLKDMSFETKTTTFFISRAENVIADELQTLARNEAIRSHANAIWPSTKVTDGKQSFFILRCPRN
jgi:hypothetical protein